MSNPSLGRGLDALLSRKMPPPRAAQPTQQIPVQSEADEKIYELPIDVIRPNPNQPRSEFDEPQLAELAQSIREYGIIQPLVVSKKDNTYILIAGERRLRAAKSIGLTIVPVVIRDTADHERLAIALIENIQRVDLNPMELALGYKRLIEEFNITHGDLGKRLGKSRPVISNTLRYFNLHPEIQEALRDRRLDSGQGKVIVSLIDHDEQLKLYRQVIDEKLTVAETTRRLRQMSQRHADMVGAKPADIVRKEDLLREYFGTKVDFIMRGEKGCIRIDFYSREELNQIMRKILD